MGYKLLGFIVWQGIKLYLRRQQPGLSRKLAVAGVGGVALLIGGVAVERRLHSGD